MTAFIDTDYNWWKNISADARQYAAAKESCANMVIDVVDRHRPGFKDRIEVVDVSTPLTRERFTGNWMGAMQARRPGRSMVKALLQSAPRYASKDVDGFYAAGQWVEAWGRITTAVQSGRKAIRAMCRNDGYRFTTGKA